MNRKRQINPELKQQLEHLQQLIDAQDIKGVARQLNQIPCSPLEVKSPQVMPQYSHARRKDKEFKAIVRFILDKLEEAHAVNDFVLSSIFLRFLVRANKFRIQRSGTV